MGNHNNKSNFVTMAVRDIPPDVYVLPSDGKNGVHLCRLRSELVQFIATFANPDGSGISVGRIRCMKKLGVKGLRTVDRLFSSLQELTFVTNGNVHGLLGTRLRTLHWERLRAAAGLPALSAPSYKTPLVRQVTNALSAPSKPSPLVRQVPADFAHNQKPIPKPKPTGGRVVCVSLDDLLAHVPYEMQTAQWSQKNSDRERMSELLEKHGSLAVCGMVRAWYQRATLTGWWTAFLDCAAAFVKDVAKYATLENDRRYQESPEGKADKAARDAKAAEESIVPWVEPTPEDTAKREAKDDAALAAFLADGGA